MRCLKRYSKYVCMHTTLGWPQRAMGKYMRKFLHKCYGKVIQYMLPQQELIMILDKFLASLSLSLTLPILLLTKFDPPQCTHQRTRLHRHRHSPFPKPAIFQIADENCLNENVCDALVHETHTHTHTLRCTCTCSWLGVSAPLFSKQINNQSPFNDLSLASFWPLPACCCCCWCPFCCRVCPFCSCGSWLKSDMDTVLVLT